MNIKKESPKCQEMQRLILLFTDLDDREKSEVLEHTQHCLDCHEVLKQQAFYRSVIEHVSKQIPQVQHASRLTHSVMSHIHQPQPAEVRVQVLRWFRIPVTVAAILLVVMLLGSVQMNLKQDDIQTPGFKQSSAETPIQHYFKTYQIKERSVSRYQSYRSKAYEN